MNMNTITQGIKNNIKIAVFCKIICSLLTYFFCEFACFPVSIILQNLGKINNNERSVAAAASVAENFFLYFFFLSDNFYWTILSTFTAFPVDTDTEETFLSFHEI